MFMEITIAGVTNNKMIESSFIEQMDSEMGCDFFDHIDDLLDFSNEELELGSGGLEEWPSNDGFAVSSSNLSGSHSQSTEEDLPGELSVPCDDMEELEWLSNFVEDSFSAGNIDIDYKNKDQQFRTSSPVSVLETSSCSGKTIPLCFETTFPGRARTKRPRPTSFSGRSIPLVLSNCSENNPTPEISDTITQFPVEFEFESFAESQPTKKIRKPKKKKLPEEQLQVRKCLHCEIQKTPQWRTGPMGPKTLCNACGVRYKSGRLFPEYRPAASPTFVSSKHSNSHKKVLEMRVKTWKKSAGIVPESDLLPEVSLPESEFLLQSGPVMGYL